MWPRQIPKGTARSQIHSRPVAKARGWSLLPTRSRRRREHEAAFGASSGNINPKRASYRAVASVLRRPLPLRWPRPVWRYMSLIPSWATSEARRASSLRSGNLRYQHLQRR
jgi:hypothetical protein